MRSYHDSRAQGAEDEMKFGEKLRQLRKEQNITLQQVADVIGVSESYLSQVERGEKAPLTPKRLVQVLWYLECSHYLKPMLRMSIVERGTVEFDYVEGSQMMDILIRLSIMQATGDYDEAKMQQILTILEEA